MERRNAITAAATASLTLLAGAGGMLLSSGILEAAADDGVGQIDPVPTTASITVAQDPTTTSVFPTTTAPAPIVPATPPVTITERAVDATSATSAVRTEDDDDTEDHGDLEDHDDDDDEDEGPEAEDHEYEGADDDD